MRQMRGNSYKDRDTGCLLLEVVGFMLEEGR